MSVESEILRIQRNIANAYAAVSEKGGEVPLQPTSANLATAVSSIPSGESITAGDGISKDGDTISVTTPVRGIIDKSDFDALPEAQKNKGLYVVTGDSATVAPGWSNPNLLDNWYFVDPINQRGQTIYTGITYTIDRWRMRTSACSVSLNPNGSVSALVLGAGYGQFVQQLENAEQFQGKQLTVSLLSANTDGEELYLLLNDGKQQVGATIKDGLVSASMNIDENPTTIFCGIQNNNQELVASLCPIAMKLELGPFQTLAHQDVEGNWMLNDSPPNEALELAKCQRYFLNLLADDNTTYTALGFGRADTDTVAFVQVPIPCQLRTTPVIGTSGQFMLSGLPVKSISMNNYRIGLLTVNVTVDSSLTPGQIYTLQKNGDSTFFLDSDL